MYIMYKFLYLWPYTFKFFSKVFISENQAELLFSRMILTSCTEVLSVREFKMRKTMSETTDYGNFRLARLRSPTLYM